MHLANDTKLLVYGLPSWHVGEYGSNISKMVALLPDVVAIRERVFSGGHFSMSACSVFISGFIWKGKYDGCIQACA